MGVEVENRDCLLEVLMGEREGVEEIKLLERISSWVPHVFLNCK